MLVLVIVLVIGETRQDFDITIDWEYEPEYEHDMLHKYRAEPYWDIP